MVINVNTFVNSGRAQQPAPQAGRISLATTLDFTTIGPLTQYLLDPTYQIQNKIFWPQVFGVYVNNINGTNKVDIIVEDTQYKFSCPSLSAGWFPAICTPASRFYVQSVGVGNGVDVVLCNWDQKPFVYTNQSAGTIAVNVRAFPPAATTITNRNKLLAAGVAFNVFPATGALVTQKVFTNASGVDVWYNFNIAATGNPANDQYLAPGQTVTLPFANANPISFFSAAGAQILAYDWS